LRLTLAGLVPAVVGRAMRGREGLASGSARPITSRVVEEVARVGGECGDRLAASSTLPPPTATTRSGLGGGSGPGDGVGDCGFTADAEEGALYTALSEQFEQGVAACWVGAGDHQARAAVAPPRRLPSSRTTTLSPKRMRWAVADRKRIRDFLSDWSGIKDICGACKEGIQGTRPARRGRRFRSSGPAGQGCAVEQPWSNRASTVGPMAWASRAPSIVSSGIHWLLATE
jgi:hypothetical protein